MFRRRFGSLLLALVVLLSGSSFVLAVEGEPAPPELCNLDARTIDSIRELSAQPPPEEPIREPLPNPFITPDGDELGSKTRLEVKKDLRRAIGCLNTGNLLLSLAAFTDEYVQRLIIAEGGVVTDELAATLTATEPREEDQYIAIIDFQEMTILPDDSVLTIVYGDDPLDNTKASYTAFYMVEVERGRWLIDQFETISREEDDKSNEDASAKPTATP